MLLSASFLLSPAVLRVVKVVDPGPEERLPDGAAGAPVHAVSGNVPLHRPAHPPHPLHPVDGQLKAKSRPRRTTFTVKCELSRHIGTPDPIERIVVCGVAARLLVSVAVWSSPPSSAQEACVLTLRRPRHGSLSPR